MRLALASLALLTGCNLVLGLTEPSARDDAGPPVDAVDADGVPVGPWGDAVALFTGLDASDERTPAVSPGGDELYLAQARATESQHDVYRSRRVATQWQAPVLVAELASPKDDLAPRFSLDGTAVYLSSDRAGGAGGLDVWVSRRATASPTWGAPSNQAIFNSALSDRFLSPCAQGDGVVLASDRGGGGHDDLYVAAGEAISLIDVAAGPANETAAFVTADCLTVYFASDSTGNYDLYVMSRPDGEAQFGAPVAIDELNTSANELDPWVSADGHQILFARGTGGIHDLYESTR